MLDVSLGELAIIMVVALIVIGPKELPTVIRHITDWLRQLRSFSQQITSQLSSLDQSGEILKLKEELQEQARFIRDAEGKIYLTYDISDLMPPAPASLPSEEHAAPDDTVENAHHANKN